jgi:hypothetical protein
VRAEEVISRMPEGELVGAEVGVDNGRMSAELLTRAPGLTLYMIDSWQALSRKKGALSNTEFASGRRVVVHSDSLEAAKHVEDNSFDFVFIDADHSYEAVRDDIAAWAPKVKPGGWLCGHDHGKGVVSCLGVDKAVHQFIEGTDMTLNLGRDYTWFVRCAS